MISIPLGVLAAVRHDRLTDYLLRFLSFIGNSLPNFFVAMLLMELLAIRLGWLPVISSGTTVKSAVMPTLTLFKHILPNIIGPILVTSMLDIGTMMMELAGLSFLGLGAKPPTAEWGSMMSDARSLLSSVPWVTLAPGFAIFVSVMIFNLLGDTVRDYADPKSRGR